MAWGSPSVRPAPLAPDCATSDKSDFLHGLCWTTPHPTRIGRHCLGGRIWEGMTSPSLSCAGLGRNSTVGSARQRHFIPSSCPHSCQSYLWEACQKPKKKKLTRASGTSCQWRQIESWGQMEAGLLLQGHHTPGKPSQQS